MDIYKLVRRTTGEAIYSQNSTEDAHIMKVKVAVAIKSYSDHEVNKLISIERLSECTSEIVCRLIKGNFVQQQERS